MPPEHTTAFSPPERFNLAEHLLDARITDGAGDRVALLGDGGPLTYHAVQRLADRFAGALGTLGVAPEQRVIIALPDGPEYVGALFGTLKLGAVAVMVNPALPDADLAAVLGYTRARAVVTHRAGVDPVRRAAPPGTVVAAVGDRDFDATLAAHGGPVVAYPTHRDDPAIWLFSGGTTGRPKAVVQTHASFANTTHLYGRGVIGYRESDITLSVPKLYFGYATGSNLFFPFAAGARAALFPEPATAEVLFRRIAEFRPTVLINVPTMINKMVSHPDARRQDLSCLRVCTSAGEALPVELHQRWMDTFGVELLDGLGTAEMWHIFISNRPGAARPGTLGQVVPGFDVKVCDDEGHEVPRGEVGWLWVRGGSRAIGYWQRMEDTKRVFRGEWYVSGDLISMDAGGYVTYAGRGDEMLKVGGKWLAPQEVESCLLEHPAVAEAAVVGITDDGGLVKPYAYVVPKGPTEGLAEALRAFVLERLQPYKAPRGVTLLDALPRTHLGKVDRGALRRGPSALG